MNRLRHVASGVAWYLALLLLIPGVSRYWTFLAFGDSSSALEQPLFVIAYSVAGVCVLVAFLWSAPRRRLIFGVFVLSLFALRAQDGTPTLERILAFVTCAAVLGIVLEFLRQNLPLFRSLVAAKIGLGPILLKTLLLWSPALLFVAIGLLLNYTLTEQVKQSLYDSALIDEHCEISDDPAKSLIPCTPFADRLPAGAIAELPLEESIARQVERLFLLRRKAILENLSLRPLETWTNRAALMEEITALQRAVHPTVVLQLKATPRVASTADDPQIRTLEERLRHVHPGLAGEKVQLGEAIRLRQEALRKEQREKDPAAFDIRSLGVDTFIELAWINTGPALRLLSLDLNERLDRKATPAEMSAAMRIGVVRVMTHLEAETKRRLHNALRNKGVIAYDSGIVRRLCRLEVAHRRTGEDVVFDCPAKTGEHGWALSPLSFRENIDLSIRRWRELRERALEQGLIESGLIAARTADEVKSAHARLWSRDRPLPRRIGLRLAPCGFLDLGCHLSNYAKRSAESTYADTRRELRRKSVRVVDSRADAGASSAIEQIDLARSELYGGLADAGRAIESSIVRVAKAGAVASALLQLWLALAIIKSLLYVLATEVFHVKGPSEIGLDSDVAAEGHYEVSTTIEIPTSFETPLNTTVIGVNQGKRTVVPQPFSAILARILHWKWALHRGTRVGNAPVRFTQPGGQTGVAWHMKEGEEIVFRYRDLLGFSDNVKLGTTVSLQLSTLLFGRYVYHTARSVGGSGLLLLSVKGHVEKTQDAVEAFPLERLIAWNKHTKFRVTDDRTFGAVFKDGFIVQAVRQRGPPSGLVLVGAPASRTALVQGTLRFVRVFVVPF